MKKYKALKFWTLELKLLQHADNTEIFVTTNESINEIFYIIDKYEKGAGAKLR